MSYIDQYRDDRNTIAHAQSVDFDSLRDVEMYSILLSSHLEDTLPANFKLFAKIEMDHKILDFKENLNKTNREIENYMIPIYDILENQFKKIYQRLKSNQ